MSRVKDLAEALEQLSLAEAAELRRVLAAAGVQMTLTIADAATAPRVADRTVEPEPAPEPTLFDVELVRVGSSVTEAVKVLKVITELSLTECKDLALRAPVVVRRSVTEEYARGCCAQLLSVGCTARNVPAAG
jgi:ribosomal protein L7/L12